MSKLASLCLLVIIFMMPLGRASAAQRDVELLIVTGAAGEAEYAEKFEKQVTVWKAACEKSGIAVSVIGKDDQDAEALAAALKEAATKTTGQFWLVLIGHGTFDNREVKFNLRGPDVSAKQLAAWCQPIQRELIFIDGGSCSAGFLQSLAGKRRVIVTGTKSADEIQYARFGEFFAPAIAGDLAADLNQDQQVSLIEAFRHANKQVASFYEAEERLATEQALIDDNGDGVGTRSELFTAQTKDLKDGQRAAQITLVLSEEEKRLTEAQRAKRDALELKLEALKAKRAELKEAEYYRQLEGILRELSAVYSAP